MLVLSKPRTNPVNITGQTEDSGQPTVLASQLMRNPAVLAALQDKLGSMVGHNSGYIQRCVFSLCYRQVQNYITKFLSKGFTVMTEIYKYEELLYIVCLHYLLLFMPGFEGLWHLLYLSI